MSNKIVSRTVSGTPDKRLVLVNGQAARRIPILDDWIQLRIGIMVSINPVSAVTITGSPKLAFGVCNGITNLLGDSTTNHFLGIRYRQAQLDYNTSGSEPCYYRSISGGGMGVVHKAGTTETLSSSGGLRFGLPASPSVVRTCLFVDIDKSTTPWRLKWNESNTNGPANYDDAADNWTTDQLVATMQLNSLDDINSVHAGSAIVGWIDSPVSVPDEETNGVFDAVGLLWDRQLQEMEFSDVKWRRVA